MIDLHTYASANGYRAAILLEETELPYRVHAVDLKSAAHRTPQFLAINPLGLVPAIVDHDTGGAPVCIGENLAIALYLVEKSGRLAPSTPAARALAWQWSSAGVSGLGPALFGIFQARSLGAQAHAPMIARQFENVRRIFAAMDGALARQWYLAGDDYTYADALLLPYVSMSAPSFDIDLGGWPHLLRWRDEIAERPAVIKGMTVPHPR